MAAPPAGLAHGYPWNHGSVRLQGYSVAGVSTSVAFADADVCFDVAQGLPFQMTINNLLITHGHMDHASGLPYLIGQKSMMSQETPRVYMPPSLVPHMNQLMRIWSTVEDHSYQFQFIPVELDKEYPLKANYFFKAFPTIHRVPSNGYTVFERKKKMKKEYAHLERDEILKLKSQGIEIEALTDEPVLSFTGDTQIEFLDSRPWVAQSKVLMMECTFIDKKKTVANAREWGHLHLDELIPRLDSLKCEKIVLIHVSARYTTAIIKQILDERLPEHWKTKVELFPRPI